MTMTMPGFRLSRPSDVAAAIAAHGGDETSRYLAGGTDLIVNLRRGLGNPSLLIDLTGIEELSELAVTGEGLRVGACVTLKALAQASAIRQHYGALAAAADTVAAQGHRNIATVGGNLCLDTRCVYYNQSQWWRNANGYCLKHGGEICHVAPQGERCHAAFSGDLAPALIVLGAEVEIAGPDGRRRIPLDELYREDGRAHLTLGASELIIAVHLPKNPPASGYEKVRLRGSVDFPLAGVAVALACGNSVVLSLSVALTGTNSRPFRLAGTGELEGRAVDETLLKQLDKLVQKQAQPMRTTTASAHYRRLAAAALTRRLTARLAAEAGSAA